jgi:hypothetical protein
VLDCQPGDLFEYRAGAAPPTSAEEEVDLEQA